MGNNIVLVLDDDFIREEFEKIYGNDSEEFVERSMRNLKRNIYNLVASPRHYPFKMAGQMISQDMINNNQGFDDVAKYYDRSKTAVKKQVSRVTGKKRSEKFIEKAKEIKEFCFKKIKEREESLGKGKGFFIPKEVYGHFDLTRWQAENYFHYLQEEKNFDVLYIHNAHLMNREQARRTLETRKTSRPEDRKKRLKDIVSIFDSYPKGTLSIEKLVELMNMGEYDVIESLINKDLYDLRQGGHELKVLSNHPKQDVVSPEVMEKVENIKNIVEIMGYVPKTIISKVLGYGEQKTRHAVDRLEIVHKDIYDKFKEEQKVKEYEMKRSIRDIKSSVISEIIEMGSMSFEEYWFAIQVVKNNYNIHLDEKLFNTIKLFGDKFGHVTEDEIKTYTRFKKMYEWIENNLSKSREENKKIAEFYVYL